VREDNIKQPQNSTGNRLPTNLFRAGSILSRPRSLPSAKKGRPPVEKGILPAPDTKPADRFSNLPRPNRIPAEKKGKPPGRNRLLPERNKILSDRNTKPPPKNGKLRGWKPRLPRAERWVAGEKRLVATPHPCVRPRSKIGKKSDANWFCKAPYLPCP